METRTELKNIPLDYRTLGKVFEYGARNENMGYVRVERANHKNTMYIPCSNPLFDVDIVINVYREPYEQEARSKMARSLLEGLTSLIPLDSLELPVRARRVIQERGITTVNELSKQSTGELFMHRNCGKKTISKIQKQLAKYGLTLETDITKNLSKQEVEEK